MWIEDVGTTVGRVEVFDGWGRFRYMAAFEQFHEVEGVVVPQKIILSDDQGSVLSLELERFWTKVEIPEDAYTFEGCCGTVNES